MTKQESLNILNRCLHELENMSQEEFDRREKQYIRFSLNIMHSLSDTDHIFYLINLDKHY